jgi:hypothetical protein
LTQHNADFTHTLYKANKNCELKENDGNIQEREREKSTGRSFGSIFQHFSMIFASSGGQFFGISGVNPLSLLF